MTFSGVHCIHSYLFIVCLIKIVDIFVIAVLVNDSLMYVHEKYVFIL
jgi:hypothetical protein